MSLGVNGKILVPAVVQDQNAIIRKLELDNIRLQERLELALNTTRKDSDEFLESIVLLINQNRKRNRLRGQVTEPLSKRRKVASGIKNNAELDDEDFADGQTDTDGTDDELITREPDDKTIFPDDFEDTIKFSEAEDTAQFSDDSEDSLQYFDALETPEDENLSAESGLMFEEPTLKILALTEEINKTSGENKELCFKIMNLESNEEILGKKQKDLEVNVCKLEEQCKAADDKLIHYQEKMKALKIIGRAFREKYEIAQTEIISLKAEIESLKKRNKESEFGHQKNLADLVSAKNEEIGQLLEKNARYRDDNNQFQDEIVQYQEENDQLRDDNDWLQAEHDRLIEDNYRLHEQVQR